jgi:predicted ATPase
VERARLLIEHARSLGETLEDPLLLFSVLYGFWAARFVAFDGNAMRDVATEFLSLAERQSTPVPRMVGHRNMGVTLLHVGEIEEALVHFDKTLAIYDPSKHRQLATRFGQDIRVAILFYRSLAHWAVGYPERALTDAAQAVQEARDIGQAATLLPALTLTSLSYCYCGDYESATRQVDEVIALADEKRILFWKIGGNLLKGYIFARSGKPADAIQMIKFGVNTWQSTGARVWLPIFLTGLATAHAELNQLDDAWRGIDEARVTIERTNERWCEAEVTRVAGEIVLKAASRDLGKAQAYFEDALAIARKQHAKSWELRAAMSMARLCRHVGKPDEARDVLASVYGLFSEGLETLDLKRARALLDELA